MKYINFSKEEQINFMNLVRNKTNLNWTKLAQFLRLTKGMVSFYVNGKSKLPKENYEQLCALAKIKCKSVSYIEIKNKVEKIRKVSKINEKLAELIGILAGDGHLSKINYEISVTCHRKDDRNYVINYIFALFRELFAVNVKIKEQNHNNTIKCVVNSKLLSNYLVSNFKIPLGKKKGKLHIPKLIFEQKELLKSYLRGLFDTDGSFYVRRKNNMVISISSRDNQFLEEVNQAFIKLGYTPCLSGKNLFIYNQEHIKRFFNEVGSSNKKHQNKYDNFIKELTVFNATRRWFNG